MQSPECDTPKPPPKRCARHREMTQGGAVCFRSVFGIVVAVVAGVAKGSKGSKGSKRGEPYRIFRYDTRFSRFGVVRVVG